MRGVQNCGNKAETCSAQIVMEGRAELLTLQPMSLEEKSAAQLVPDNFQASTHSLQTSLPIPKLPRSLKSPKTNHRKNQRDHQNHQRVLPLAQKDGLE